MRDLQGFSGFSPVTSPLSQPKNQMAMAGFYRRLLPSLAVDFGSSQGKVSR
jgi:hypothetical protein